MKPGTLYLCATPIGNLEDITLRVLRVLREVDLIAAEDTRHTRKLLAHYDIHTPLISYHEHNRLKQGAYLLEQLQSGRNVALVSDAGMPGISDPGEDLVSGAIARGITVVPCPGPSAALTALVASGLPASSFCFEGFLPAVAPARRRRLEKLKGEERTMIFYEAPHRLLKTLADMVEVLGDRPVTVARELTKLHEEFWRGTLSGAGEYFSGRPLKGEFTLVVAGRTGSNGGGAQPEPWEKLTPAEHVHMLCARGMPKKEAIKEVARLRGLPRREGYNHMVKVDMGES